ncbi:hypothetical protein GIB67_019697 [Kingdonia uniflora]|uniref:Uncharacterized protein n=1 Tax=Kingdonia uniflora TaxID=39325 RepID=A0A7J7MJX0_9MAGN|nr:hypothetical protein GIB67_019697 [Kingdonia uniflora]
MDVEVTRSFEVRLIGTIGWEDSCYNLKGEVYTRTSEPRAMAMRTSEPRGGSGKTLLGTAVAKSFEEHEEILAHMYDVYYFSLVPLRSL